MKNNIFLIDDDKNILTSVSMLLEAEGFKVRTFSDGESGLKAILESNPDVAVVDIKMPRLDGIELLKKLRRTSNMPVIFLTSKDTEIDELLGLKIGADDYITKPFSPRELVSRVKAVFRRIDKQNLFAERKYIQIKNLNIDIDLQMAKLNDKKVDLTPKEFEILKNLCSYPGKIYSRQEIIDTCFGMDFDGFDRTIDTHIANLRKKLRIDDNHHEYIESVYGLGYRLIDEE